MTVGTDRRSEVLALAADLFAERGLRATTVRDIADAAGILSGSLYHHFDSKESMVDEILRGFLDPLFERYHEIVETDRSPRAMIEALVAVSFAAIEDHHAAVAIYQAEARRLSEQPRFAYVLDLLSDFRQLWFRVLRAGVADGTFRPDLDIELAYRFLRDTVWVAVSWYRPGGKLGIDEIGREYLSIVLDGIAAPRPRSRRAAG